MLKQILNFPLVFLPLMSCSTKDLMNESITNQNIQRTKDKKNEIWAQEHVFSNNIQARNYVLERRLSLQRIYQLTSEQYFGTPVELDCRDNIDTDGKIQKIKKGEIFTFRLLSNKNFSLGDCLKENNDFKVYYKFYLCGSQVYEYRIYKNINESLEPENDENKCNKGTFTGQG